MLRRPCGVVVDTLENLVVVFQKLNFSLEFNLISRTIQFQIFNKPPDIYYYFSITVSHTVRHGRLRAQLMKLCFFAISLATLFRRLQTVKASIRLLDSI